MFAKLKKKIQDETQNVVGAMDTDRRPGIKPVSPAPGLASPVSKDYPGNESPFSPSGGPIFSHSRRDSDASSKMGSRTSSVDDIARESSNKEEVLAMLMKRTEQVKKLESKISELAAIIKEKNKKIDKLEGTLDKQQEESQKQLEELTEKYKAEKAKYALGFKEAVGNREEELRAKVQNELEQLAKKNSKLSVELRKAEEFRDKYFKKEEENDEFQGLASQEIAKVKHMLLIAEHETKEKTDKLEDTSKQLSDLQGQVSSLDSQLKEMTTKSQETQRKLSEANSTKAELEIELTTLSTELESLQKSHSQLQGTHQKLQGEMTLAQQQSSHNLEALTEQNSHHLERIATLEQRLKDNNLTEDEQLQALEKERELLEKKLSDAREQLAELRSSSSQKVALLDEQIIDLKRKLSESQQDSEQSRKDLQEAINRLQKEVDSWKSKLQMALLEVKDKQKLLDTLKENQEAEMVRHVKTSSQMEENFKDQFRQLKSQLETSERARERERLAAQEKITKLENGQEDWLEREIDAERQITRLEEDLQKTKVEVSEKDKDILNYKRQLIVKKKEFEDLDAKKLALESDVKAHEQKISTVETLVSSLRQEIEANTLERDGLLVRNAQLSQDFESHKRSSAQEVSEVRQELFRREAAIAGLEQSLQDLQEEGRLHEEKLHKLEAQRDGAIEKVESEEISRLKERLSAADEQLSDKSKTIKMLQQRLTDLKKTLQRELKVQALPNDELPERAGPVVQQAPSFVASSAKMPVSSHETAANGLHASVDASLERPTLAVSQTTHSKTESHRHPPSSHRGPHSAYPSAYPSEIYSDSALPSGRPSHPPALPPYLSSTPPFRPTNNSRHSSVHVNRQSGTVQSYDGTIDINFEYLKHVILKFMLSHEHEAIHLIKAVSVLLHFTPDEQRLIRETLEWKTSWFRTKPQLGKGQNAKQVPSSYL